MKRMEEVLLKLKKSLDNAGIEFVLAYGTCLGAYRDNSLIDDDWDIDVSVFDGNREDMVRCYGWNKESADPTNNQYVLTSKDGVICDVLFWDRNGDVYELPFRNRAGLKPIPVKFSKTKKIKFLGEEFLIPFHTEEYLKMCYGDTWNIRIKNKTAIIR